MIDRTSDIGCDCRFSKDNLPQLALELGPSQSLWRQQLESSTVLHWQSFCKHCMIVTLTIDTCSTSIVDG